MLMRRRSASQVYRALHEAPDTEQITSAAREAFARANPDVKLQRLVIVIAAYNEAGNIGAVLDEIPDQIGEEAVPRWWSNDGSGAGPRAAAKGNGALVCTPSAT